MAKTIAGEISRNSFIQTCKLNVEIYICSKFDEMINMRIKDSHFYRLLEKVTRFTGFAGGKVIKAIHLTFRLESSSL